MALNIEDTKGVVLGIQADVSKLKAEFRILVEEAEIKPNAANKVFGIDKMTGPERRAALRKTTLVGSLKVST